MKTSAEFSASLLHPKYWLTWLGLMVLRLLVLLPLSVQFKLGSAAGRIAMRLMPARVKVARRNLEACFPNKSEVERETLLIAHFEQVGMALFDTGNAWYWSDERIQRHMSYSGMEHVEALKAEGKGVILLACHCLMLEPGARVFGQLMPGVGVYRPNKKPLFEYLQVKGRLRSNKALIPMREVRSMVKVLRQGEVIWYTQDQDGGRRGNVFVPYFGINASTAGGAPVLAKLGKARILPFFVERKADHSGYHIEVGAPLDNFPSGDDLADTARCNEVTEELVMRRPDQYMWLHRRFKTRPSKSDPKFYQ